MAGSAEKSFAITQRRSSQAPRGEVLIVGLWANLPDVCDEFVPQAPVHDFCFLFVHAARDAQAGAVYLGSHAVIVGEAMLIDRLRQKLLSILAAFLQFGKVLFLLLWLE